MLKRIFTRLAIGQWKQITLDRDETFGGRLVPAGLVRVYNGRDAGFVAWCDVDGNRYIARE